MANDWSEKEQGLLHHEEFVAEVLQKRQKPDSSTGGLTWRAFLESSGGAALITVVIGGVFANVIAACVQERARERQLELTWLQERSKQAMLAYESYLSEREEATRTVFERVGTCMSSTRNLIDLTRSDFKLDRFEGAGRERVLQQRDEVRAAFNRADSEWNVHKDTMAIEVEYYHSGGAEVNVAAATLHGAVSEYMSCGRKWYSDNIATGTYHDDVGEACIEEGSAVRGALETLAAELRRSREYFWDGWETLSDLRDAMEASGESTN